MPQVQTKGGPRTPLSRERIVEAALRIMDRDGLDAVSMRRLGRELGVEAMSLYNHVRDKEDVLQGILEAVLAQFELPEDLGGDWTDRVQEMARSLRALLHRHPHSIGLFAERHGPPLSPDALRPIEAALDVLQRGGLTKDDTIHAYRTLVGYVFGYVVLEAGDLFADHSDGSSGWPDPTSLVELLPAERIPRLVELLPELVQCDPDEEFEYGLEVILAGLRTRLRGSVP